MKPRSERRIPLTLIARRGVALRARILLEFEISDDPAGRRRFGYLSNAALDDPGFDRELLEQVVTPALDERAVRYFGREYFVYWCSMSRSIPTPEPLRNSFCWHCDRGPEQHLKLLFYLNDY